MEVAPGLYSVCPGLAAIQYAQSHDLYQTIALLMELRGSFSLPEDHKPVAATVPPTAAKAPSAPVVFTNERRLTFGINSDMFPSLS